MCASDARSFRLEALQIDRGECPWREALETGAPVLEPNIRDRQRRVWPAFSPAVIAEDLRAVFAYLLVMAPSRVAGVRSVQEIAEEIIDWRGSLAVNDNQIDAPHD